MNKYSKLITFVQVVIFACIASFIISALLDGDWYKGIFVGIFIIIYYYSATAVNSMYKESLNEENKGFFEPRLYTILVISLFLLAMTTLVTNIIFVYGIDYCKNKTLFYSEMRCALQSTEQGIQDKYTGPYDDYDDNY